MRPFILVSLFLISGSLSAQIFTEASQVPFPGVWNGSIAFADIDGDNDQDVLITGDGQVVHMLFVNDGQGNYTPFASASLKIVKRGDVAFADVDNDNDVDLMITGWCEECNSQEKTISRLYINDGTGNFSEVTDTPFKAVYYSSIAFADMDGDQDQDVLITGNISWGVSATLYKNDGTGSFTEVPGTPFTGIVEGTAKFVDVDGDSDQDVFISGLNDSLKPVVHLYLNDGLGNFTELGTTIKPLGRSSFDFADVDGDSDPDLFITGEFREILEIHYKASIYLNDGTGHFFEDAKNSFEGIVDGSVLFEDVDQDEAPDLLITGRNFTGQALTKLFLNNGQGVFDETPEVALAKVDYSSVAFADVDGDDDVDLLITGRTKEPGQPPTLVSELYFNQADSFPVNATEIVRFNSSISVFPNPAGNDFLNVMFTSVKFEPIEIRLYDSTGRQVFDMQTFSVIGINIISVNVKEKTTGLYFLLLKTPEKEVQTTVVIQ